MDETFAVRGRVATSDSILVDGAVVIQDQEAIWIGEALRAQATGFGAQMAIADSPTDKQYILPDLVDVYYHRGGGQPFPGVRTAGEALAAVWEHRLYDTTTLATPSVTQSPGVLHRRTQMLVDLTDAGEIVRIHFEGPFVSEARKDAQDAHCIQASNPALTRELIIVARNHTVITTLAPGEKRAFGFRSVAKASIGNGALPSYGHTDCDSRTVHSAVLRTREKLGLTPEGARRSPRYTITHLLSGVEPFHHHQPKLALKTIADAIDGGAVLGLIGDRAYPYPDTVRAVYELMGRDLIVSVTGVMATTDVVGGDYMLGGQAVIIQEGQVCLHDEDNSTDLLVGGTAHLLDAVRNSWRNSRLPLIGAVYCTSIQGAKILDESERIGSLQVGKLTGMVVVDENLYPL